MPAVVNESSLSVLIWNEFISFSTESAFASLWPEFSSQESAELDEVKEFRADIDSFPKARVTWLKDGLPLNDVTAEITTSLRQLNETR